MQRLNQQLQRIDGKGYKAYKDILGTYHGHGYQLHIDHVQGDPYASPSRIRLVLDSSIAKIDPSWLEHTHRQIALEDFITRAVANEIYSMSKSDRQPIHKRVTIDRPGQEILQRSSVEVRSNQVDIRLSVELPARGRRILGQQAIELLCDAVPTILTLTFRRLNVKRLEDQIQLADQQQEIRTYLEQNGYIAFVGNDSVLPRESGVSNRPLASGQVVPFQAPQELEIDIPLSNGDAIKGMGIPRGITLIVGGGYHGKSTLLQAIERGVYNHIRGDGREFVITNSTACKIRAEDGRRVEKVNISPFIGDLPYGKDTVSFSTDNASGSTSQAANIMEALEMKSEALLIDEDTSATNFMIRDARMQKLVAKEKEPITPYVDKVKPLYKDNGVSTILVLGGSGDYFDVADHVLMMDQYRPFDVTAEAKRIAKGVEQKRSSEGGQAFGRMSARTILQRGLDTQRGKKEKVDAKGVHTILFGTQSIHLAQVEQIVDPSQTRAIANILRYMAKKKGYHPSPLVTLIDQVYEDIAKHGIDIISPFYGKHPGDLALPRKFEVAAALNRLRSLTVQ